MIALWRGYEDDIGPMEIYWQLARQEALLLGPWTLSWDGSLEAM